MAKTKAKTLTELRELVKFFVDEVEAGQVTLNCDDARESLKELALGAGIPESDLPEEIVPSIQAKISFEIDFNGTADDLFNANIDNVFINVNGQEYLATFYDSEEL